MFKEHPEFQKPTDSNGWIWRYLDFTKFVDLLDTRSLFFTRADRFHDRFEGSYTPTNVKHRSDVFLDHNLPVPDQFMQSIAKHSEDWRRWVAINCWHANAHESAAMWHLYLKSNEGIAIRSSYNRLISSFATATDDIYVGMVRYIDYETEWIPEGNAFYPFVHKRKSFAHENEIRAVINRTPPLKGHLLDLSQPTITDGISIPLDLEQLIEHIFVAPDTPPWLTRLVESVARKYAINATVKTSTLSNDPVY